MIQCIGPQTFSDIGGHRDLQKGYRFLMRWRRVALRWLFITVCFYGGFLLLLTLLQSKLLYFPSHDFVNPQRVGLAVEDVWTTSTQGTKIHGWWVPKAQARMTILVCHGNAGNLTHRIGLVRELRKRLHANVMIFDYQGYGKSQGSPSEQGTYDDAKAVWDFLVNIRQIPAHHIVLFGRSLGTSIAAHLATRVQPAALILDSPFSSFVDVASAHYPWIPVRWIARFRYETAEYVKQRTCPLLLIHSRDDEIIPFRLGQKCFQQAKEPKEFLSIQGSHNDGFYVSLSSYMKKVDEFLTKTMAQNKPH